MRLRIPEGKSSESVQCAILKACDACADIWGSYSALYRFGRLSSQRP